MKAPKLSTLFLAVMAVVLAIGVACTREVEKEVPVEVTRVVTETVTETKEVEVVREVEAAPVYPESITIAVGALPANLVANVIPSLQSRITSRLIYGQLAALNDETGAIEPELAESYGFIPGSTDTVELKLKQGITFHNGETLDAHGLLKSFELMMSETAEVAWAYRGLDRYVDPDDRIGTLHDAVTVVDDYTLHFKLRQVDDTWANAFTFMPLPPAHLEAIGPAGYSEAPVGTGPYKFVEWERDNYIRLTRWEENPGPKPVIKDITIRHVPEAAVRVAGLKAGEFDIITATPPENVPGLISDGFRIFVGDSTQSMYIGFNIYGRSEPLSNKLVRQALLYAVDMDGIYETVAGGYGTRLQCQIVAPGGFGYNPDLVGRYDYTTPRWQSSFWKRPATATALRSKARSPTLGTSATGRSWTPSWPSGRRLASASISRISSRQSGSSSSSTRRCRKAL